MKHAADQHRQAVDYQEGDQVLLSTRYLQLKNRPRKLQKMVRWAVSYSSEDWQSSLQVIAAGELVNASGVPHIIAAAMERISMELPR